MRTDNTFWLPAMTMALLLPLSVTAQPAETSSDEPTKELPRVERLPEDDSAPNSGLPNRDSVEEIVVTTERRSQNLQDVAAVTKALNGNDLRMQGINRFTDLSNALPQLNIGNREGNVEVFIRGIGDDNNTELSEPRSAILLDGVYISRPRGLGSMFFDVERVELNIGPQGTLRGRNATGGSLNVISTRPKLGVVGGYVQLGAGNFNQREFQGALNVPLGDDFALRFAGSYLANDSKISNAGPLDVSESRATEDVAFRASARWDATSRLSVNVTGDFLDSNGTGYGGLDFFPYFQSQFNDGDTRLNARQQISDLDDPWQNVTQGSEPRQAQQIWGIRGQIKYDFDDVSIEYLGSFRSVDFFFNRSASDAFYRDFEDDRGIDFGAQSPDMTTADFLNTFSRVQFDQDFDSTVQELRVSGDHKFGSQQRLRWTAGGFFFRETGFSYFNTTADRGFVFAGVEFAFPDVERQSLAFYADTTFDILKWLRVTGGIRFTSESLDRSGFGATYLFLFPTDTDATPPEGCCGQHRFGSEGFQFQGRNRTQRVEDVDITSGAGRAELFRGGVARFGNSDDVDDQIDLILRNDQTDREISGVTPNNASRSDTFVNWRARVEVDIAPDFLTYFSLSTGTNSGGFNDAVNTPSGIIAPEFDIETVLVAELGSKNKFSIGGYQAILNVAAFWYDYQDQQFTVLAPAVQGLGGDGDGGLVSLRQNVGDSTILGLDFDYTQNLPLYLRLRANVQFLHTEFDSPSGNLVDTRFNFPGGPNDTIPFDPTGNKLPKASDWSGSISLAQFIPTPIGSFEWVASVGFRSEYFLTIFNGDGDLPEINAENYPNLDAEQLENLQNTVNGNAGSATDVVGAYLRLDLALAYVPTDNIRVEIYGKNVTDVGYAQTALVSPGTNLRFLNDPRMFGGRVQVNF